MSVCVVLQMSLLEIRGECFWTCSQRSVCVCVFLTDCVRAIWYIPTQSKMKYCSTFSESLRVQMLTHSLNMIFIPAWHCVQNEVIWWLLYGSWHTFFRLFDGYQMAPTLITSNNPLELYPSIIELAYITSEFRCYPVGWFQKDLWCLKDTIKQVECFLNASNGSYLRRTYLNLYISFNKVC